MGNGEWACSAFALFVPKDFRVERHETGRRETSAISARGFTFTVILNLFQDPIESDMRRKVIIVNFRDI